MSKHSRLYVITTLIALALLVFAGCVPESSTPESPTEFQKTVDALITLQPTKIPTHLMEGDSIRTEADFDINSYFSVLTHLSMEPGYVLDYVYLWDNYEFGGRPVIYVREEDQEPFLTYKEYVEAGGKGTSVMAQDSKVPGDRIRIDGTEEGFFEYVVLQIMGGQFYLFWHAAYDDATVICDKTGLDRLLAQYSSLPSSVEREARKLDYKPIIEFRDDQVTVKVMTFTNWGGFIQDSFTISRRYPHTIIEREKRVIVEYDCGIIM